jgi:archaemetzincin
MRELQIFHSRNCGNVISEIRKALHEIFGLETVDSGFLNPPEEAYNPGRNQYDASILLTYLIPKKGAGIKLWVLDGDIYCEDMNFIFGYALSGQGAVLSIYRLDSKELIRKEAVHEIGHVMGLEHCGNNCVMQFSNSLDEAERKPSVLCGRCRQFLGR